MSSYIELGKEGSYRQSTDTQTERPGEGEGERESADERCEECGGPLQAAGIETYCGTCGLVVGVRRLDNAFSAGAHGPNRRSGPQEWAIEPTTPFRVDRGLGSSFNLGTDGKGKGLSSKLKSKFGRLRKLDKRMDKRDIRLNEGLRDVQSMAENLGLPRYVGEDACRIMRQVQEARLPGGRMAWESLAAGALMLAARKVRIERDTEDVARYAKSSHERACAGARKIRMECELAGYTPIREAAVDAVLVELDDVLSTGEVLEFSRLGERLLQIADEEPVGPGTPRMTIAGAAVYAADRLTEGKAMTQAAVAQAASATCATSRTMLGQYSRELYDAYMEQGGAVTQEMRTRASVVGR